MNESIHLCKVLVGAEEPRSQVTEPELTLLCEHARSARVVVEIGCFEGKTAGALARSTTGDVYTVDLFKRGRLGVSCSEVIARFGHLKSVLRGANLMVIRGSSEDVAERFDRPIDLLFIDADHSYEGVRRDWELWVPKVRPGGIIALHDCRQTPHHPRYHGSIRFYYEELRTVSGFDELEGADSVALFRKDEEAPAAIAIELQAELQPQQQAQHSSRAA